MESKGASNGFPRLSLKIDVFLLHSLCKANELCFIVFKRAFAPSVVFDVAENDNFTILSYLIFLLREKNSVPSTGLLVLAVRYEDIFGGESAQSFVTPRFAHFLTFVNRNILLLFSDFI